MPKDCDKDRCSCMSRNSGKNQMNDSTLAGETSESLRVSDIDNDDDIWGSEDDAETLVNTQSRDIAYLQRVHNNRGYLDGITKGGEIGLQQGFDEGYTIGAQLGGILGELLADTVLRFSLGQITNEVKDQIFEDLRINKILSSQYFDSDFNIQNPREHPLIKKWILYFEKLGSPILF